MSKPKITYDYAEVIERLSALFPASEVKSFPLSVSKKEPWKGLVAFYIDNRAVQQRLDDTCVWRNEYKEDPRSTGSILCGISVLVDHGGSLQWITRWDGADNSDIEATKGGLSGSMRRAAVQWGIGRYLYEVPSTWQPMKAPLGNGKPQYFVNEPRMPARFLPSADRARGIAQSKLPEPEHEETTSEPKKPASKAKAKKTEVEKNQLTASQTAKFKEVSEGLERSKIREFYNQIINGKIGFDEACAEIAELIASKDK